MKLKHFSIIIFLLFFSLPFYAQKAGFIKCGDATTFYRVFGKGQPILIINGGPGMNSNGFTTLAQKLSDKNQTIIYDQRGTGKSTLSKIDSTTITMNLMVEDMECLRKELKIKKWYLLGHSFGGMLASYYATLHPNNIEGIILSSSGGIDLELLSYVSANINSATNSDSVSYWTNKIGNGDTSYNAKFERGKALAPAYVFDKKYIPIIADRLTQSNQQINGLVWADLIKMNFNCAPKLNAFKKPVLIIQGKQDIIEEKTAIKAHKAFQHSKIVLLEHCKHYGWLDAEKEYLKEINDLLVKK
ncbi:MAG: alpha/beta hydrolase [Bacteroidetes bacterium]|nr:alpha/beta hydrolase [Bacteroidota bacterium]